MSTPYPTHLDSPIDSVNHPGMKDIIQQCDGVNQTLIANRKLNKEIARIIQRSQIGKALLHTPYDIKNRLRRKLEEQRK